MPRSSRPCSRTRQGGVALAVALLFLVIITLLGLASMRGSRTAMRLALNEETRLDAQENAQSLIEAVLAKPETNFVLSLPADTQHLCYPAGLQANAPPMRAPFGCTAGVAAPLLPVGPLAAHAYVEVFRESIGGQPTVTVNSLPGSSDSYQFRFARFRVTAGYDRSAEGLGSAEVSEGVSVKLPSVKGMNLF
ncbi:MAG TPA: pilus assembly PilX N-terminal domain-containing protein [Solimonas sp.]|nr:pilus assembly PilX N-terminal domain-containing protein [Solimonas sp.]